MKKILLLAAVACISAVSINAQSFGKGDNVAGLNVGFGGSYGVPVSLTYERGIHKINNKMSIGVGAIAGYGGSSESMIWGKWKYSNILLGARGAWHYTAIKKLDLYAGLTLGYDVASAKFTWNDPKDEQTIGKLSASAGGFLWGAYAGARYYFNKSFGVNAEVGYGLAYLNIGVAYKF